MQGSPAGLDQFSLALIFDAHDDLSSDSESRAMSGMTIEFKAMRTRHDLQKMGEGRGEGCRRVWGSQHLVWLGIRGVSAKTGVSGGHGLPASFMFQYGLAPPLDHRI